MSQKSSVTQLPQCVPRALTLDTGRGLSLPVIGALLGHQQAATTQRYAHLAADPLKQASSLIGEQIAAAMRGDEEDSE